MVIYICDYFKNVSLKYETCFYKDYQQIKNNTQLFVTNLSQ